MLFISIEQNSMNYILNTNVRWKTKRVNDKWCKKGSKLENLLHFISIQKKNSQQTNKDTNKIKLQWNWIMNSGQQI